MLISCVVVDQERAWEVWGLFSLYYMKFLRRKKNMLLPWKWTDLASEKLSLAMIFRKKHHFVLL